MKLHKTPGARGHKTAEFTGAVTVKVDKKIWEKIKQKADKHADGIISVWIRYAATNYDPGGKK